jgi:hypothetical protein
VRLPIRYQETEPKARFFAERGQSEELLNLLEDLAPSVDRFFADILVMVDDPDLRQARLTLIHHVAHLFRLADRPAHLALEAMQGGVLALQLLGGDVVVERPGLEEHHRALGV